ncbi:uncharacterized protein M421DRAFT_26439, partial [Didymella exigua CBS 183.55]
IPQTAVMLITLHASVPPYISSSLSKSTPRHVDAQNLPSIQARGRKLWTSIHGKFANAVEQKLAEAHPKLPSFTVGTMYGNCLRNGRVTTSIGAIACLQAQQGFAPQVYDHVCGLKNACKDGSRTSEKGIGEEEAIRWLLSNEGCVWILEKVDQMAEAIAQDSRSDMVHVDSKL